MKRSLAYAESRRPRKVAQIDMVVADHRGRWLRTSRRRPYATQGSGVCSCKLDAVLSVSAAAQNCGWSHIDHRVSYDASGMWNPNVYRGVVEALTIAEVGGAVWEGAESRLGKTMWQGIDSEIISDLGAEAGKYIFTRVRPSTQDNPCLWFQGGHNHSFPSGEASVAAGLVTPYILDMPATTQPRTFLPSCRCTSALAGSSTSRTAVRDVLAGWAVGGVSGWYAHSRYKPILIELLPTATRAAFTPSAANMRAIRRRSLVGRLIPDRSKTRTTSVGSSGRL